MPFSLSRRASAAGYRLVGFETIGSTNEEGLARARAGEGGPLWLAASEQTAGRGRRGNSWSGPRGNLAASLLLTPGTPPAVTAQLGFVAGLATLRALESLGPSGAGFVLKWPNDILAGAAKLVGILLQVEGGAVVVGIGVNVVASPRGLAYPTASLHGLGLPVTDAVVFEALSETWCEAFEVWNGGSGFAAIRRDWLARAAGVGRELTVTTSQNVVSGVFETIDEDGQLVLRLSDGSRRLVSGGEIHFGVERAGADRETIIK